jgi:hypothetical protein
LSQNSPPAQPQNYNFCDHSHIRRNGDDWVREQHLQSPNHPPERHTAR